jgi:hypothetical protein
MTGEPGQEPDETLPLTHRPWGAKEPENPATSPSGPSTQASGPAYTPPSWSEPAPGQVTPGGTPYVDPAYVPVAYGQPMYAQQRLPHPRANTALALGLIALVGGFTCVLPVVVGPFAWWTGSRARREIREDPRLEGETQALVGQITGAIATVFLAVGLLVLVVAVVVAVVGARSA